MIAYNKMAWNWKNYLWGSVLYYGLVVVLYGGKRASLTDAEASGPLLGSALPQQRYIKQRSEWADKIVTPGGK